MAIFQPTSTDGVGKVNIFTVYSGWLSRELFLQTFPAIWQLCDTLSLDGPVFSVCWKKSGTQLLVGGDSLSLWDSPMSTVKKDISLSTAGMKMVWSYRYALITLLYHTKTHVFNGLNITYRNHMYVLHNFHCWHSYTSMRQYLRGEWLFH